MINSGLVEENDQATLNRLDELQVHLDMELATKLPALDVVTNATFRGMTHLLASVSSH